MRLKLAVIMESLDWIYTKLFTNSIVQFCRNFKYLNDKLVFKSILVTLITLRVITACSSILRHHHSHRLLDLYPFSPGTGAYHSKINKHSSIYLAFNYLRYIFL